MYVSLIQLQILNRFLLILATFGNKVTLHFFKSTYILTSAKYKKKIIFINFNTLRSKKKNDVDTPNIYSKTTKLKIQLYKVK